MPFCYKYRIYTMQTYLRSERTFWDKIYIFIFNKIVFQVSSKYLSYSVMISLNISRHARKRLYTYVIRPIPTLLLYVQNIIFLCAKDLLRAKRRYSIRFRLLFPGKFLYTYRTRWRFFRSVSELWSVTFRDCELFSVQLAYLEIFWKRQWLKWII